MIDRSVTPASFAVCTLIALYSDPYSPLHERLPWTPADRTAVEGALEASVSCLQASSLVEWLEKTLQQDHGVSLPICDLLGSVLAQGAQSLDNMLNLVDSVGVTLTEGLVDGDSAHGLYMRRIGLAVESLSFDGLIVLWQNFHAQVNDAQKRSQQRQQQGTQSDSDLPAKASSVAMSLSSQQMAILLQRTCRDLQEGRHTDSYEETELQVRAFLNQNAQLPAAYFLRFLNCIHHGERVAAMEALHQYIDHAPTTAQTALPYASVLLAATHASFGQASVAALATDEAVRVAQQAPSADSVAYAVAWLAEMAPQALTGHSLLQNCAIRATDSKLRDLQVGAQLALAHQLVAQGNVPLHDIWKHLYQAGTVPPKTDTTGMTAAQRLLHARQALQDEKEKEDSYKDRAMVLTPGYTEQMALRNITKQQLVSAGIWRFVSQPKLSEVASAAAIKGTQDLGKVYNAIHSIANTALYGLSSESESGCIYANALQRALALGRKYDDSATKSRILEEPLQRSALLLLHEWAVRRGDLQDASHLSQHMQAYLHPRLQQHYDVYRMDVGIQSVLRLSRQERYQEAIDLARSLIDECADDKNRKIRSNTFPRKLFHARLLILLATTQMDAAPDMPNIALTNCLKAVHLCQENQPLLEGLHSVAICTMAKLFLALKWPERCLALVQGALPVVMRQAHVWHQGEAIWTLARAHLDLVESDSSHTKQALDALIKAEGLFVRCHDVQRLEQVYFCQAQLYNDIGSTQQRDERAQRCLEATHHLSNPSTSAENDTPKMILEQLHASGMEELVARPLPIGGENHG